MKYFLALLVFCSVSIANAITLTTKNSCTLEGEVDPESMKQLKACVAKKVMLRNGQKYPIYIYLISPGGSVYSGLRFISFVKTLNNVHTITEFAASMAAAIDQGNPGKRYIVEHGVMMFHRASGSFRGQFEEGEIESQLRLWKKIVLKMETMQAKRIGITLKEYKDRRLNEWWLYGEEAIEQNTADKVVSVKCSKALVNTTYKKKVRSIFGTFEVTKSACPLMN